jgi:DNA modification methylase
VWGEGDDEKKVMGNAQAKNPHGGPPQVPAFILKRIVLAATNWGDRVFDPFCGNGTTWKMARELGRKFTGIERSPGYRESAIKWVLGDQAKESA